MMASIPTAAWWAWLGYLHLFFVLHLPQPALLFDLSSGSAVQGGHGRLTSTRTADVDRYAAATAATEAAAVRRSPPVAAELGALTQGFGKLRSTAQSQRTAASRGALTQLSWHWAKAVLDHATGDEARAAATQAVGIAASTWPYWLAWPETHAALTAALGSETEAGIAVDQARTRFPPQRWQGWWREQQPHARPRVPVSSNGVVDPVMPPPRRLLPFASQVLIWEPPQPQRFSATTAQSEQAADDVSTPRTSHHNTIHMDLWHIACGCRPCSPVPRCCFVGTWLLPQK